MSWIKKGSMVMVLVGSLVHLASGLSHTTFVVRMVPGNTFSRCTPSGKDIPIFQMSTTALLLGGRKKFSVRWDRPTEYLVTHVIA